MNPNILALCILEFSKFNRCELDSRNMGCIFQVIHERFRIEIIEVLW